MSKRSNKYRIRYTLEKGKRREICLPDIYKDEVVHDFSECVSSLVAYRRYGTYLPASVRRKLKNLHSDLRERLMRHGLLPWQKLLLERARRGNG